MEWAVGDGFPVGEHKQLDLIQGKFHNIDRIEQDNVFA
jgi:hypothetical protein